MKEKVTKITKNLANRAETSTIIILVVMVALIAVLQDNFFTTRTMLSYINSFTPLILLAMGQAVVVIAGGLDMSCGTTMALQLCVMTRIMDPERPITGVYALLAGLAVAVVIGLINGYAVGYLRLPAVIATYATSYVWLGIALFVTPTPGGKVVEWFRGFYDLKKIAGLEKVGGILPAALLWIVLACLIWGVVRKTRTGRYIYAVGSHTDNAYDSGINTAKIQTIAYVINAIFCLFVAIYYAGQNGAGNANLGDSLTLQAVASAVVGGVAMSGGKGSVYMSIAGALIMSLVGRIIYYANIPNAFQTFVSGIIIIAAIASSAIYAFRQRKAQLKGGD